MSKDDFLEVPKDLREFYKRNYFDSKEDYLKAKARHYMRKYYKKLRLKIIDHYTDGKRICMCPGCDVDILEFLTIDHVNNDGHEHRKSFGSTKILTFIIKNNFPDDFQILCMNCNFAKRFTKICPHLVKS